MGLIPGQGTKIHLLHGMAKKTTTYVWMLSSQKGGWTAFMTNCFLAQTHPFTLHFLALRLPAPSLILLRGSTRKTKGWKEKVHVSSCFACCSHQHYSSSSSSPWWQQLTPVFSTFSVSFLSLTPKPAVPSSEDWVLALQEYSFNLLDSNNLIIITLWCSHHRKQGCPGGSVVKNLPAKVGDSGLILGLGKSSGEGNANPLQDSCLENPVDRGVWLALVHGVEKELDAT